MVEQTTGMPQFFLLQARHQSITSVLVQGAKGSTVAAHG